MDLLDLLETDDDGAADDVYLVGLEPRRRGRLRSLIVAGLDLWCALSGGTMELSRGIDVVIRLRDDGTLLRRIAARDAADGAVIVEHLNQRMTELSPAEFRAMWSLP